MLGVFGGGSGVLGVFWAGGWQCCLGAAGLLLCAPSLWWELAALLSQAEAGAGEWRKSPAWSWGVLSPSGVGGAELGAWWEGLIMAGL